MPYTADNIEITIATNTAIIATDYGTSGAVGFSLAHAQHAKVAWGDENNTYRTTESTPLPVKISGFTGSSLVGVTGTIRGTGDFYVRTNPTIPLIIKGSTFTSDAPVSITGTVQGVTNGIPIGVTGSVSILGSNAVYGITGAVPIAITGGRSLTYGTDSVRVFGDVGICGGFVLSSSNSSIKVYADGGSTYFNTKVFSGTGTAIGASGDALKVAVTNAGFTFNVTVAATVGVTNADSPLRIQGYTGSNGTPVTIRGQNNDAVAVVAYSTLPVGISGTVEINDTDLISSIEGLKTNINTVSSNAAYVSDIFNLVNSSGNGAKVVVNSITKPTKIIHGQKTITSTSTLLSNDAIRTGITIKSPISNTTDVYIGNSLGVSTTTGYILNPGETIYIEISSASGIFARTLSGTALITYIGS